MTLSRMVKPSALVIALLIYALSTFQSMATIRTLQSLDFGTIAVTNNSFASSIAIDPNGNVQIVGGIAVLQQGQQAVYEISDFPSNQRVNVDVTVLNTQMISQIASEETFTFSVTVNSDTLQTDSSGMALLPVGGKLETSGNGSIRFSDTVFESTIQITVDF